MNLSVLEKMVREGDMSVDALRYLLDCNGECEWLDFKVSLSIDTDKELCDFAKDVLAIKNVGGGYIVVGVQDKTWEPVGLQSELHCDTKLLRDKVRRATALDLEIDIVHHKLHVPSSTGLFAIIHIRSSSKRSKRRTPTVCGKDFESARPHGLRRGDIYFRKGDSTVKLQNESELRDILDRLEEQADHDALAFSGSASPFAIEDGPYKLLEKGFVQFIGRKACRDSLLKAVMQDPRIWIINVHGPGGVGKSALVNWAVYEFYANKSFESIIQLTAKETILTASGIKQHTRSLVSLENLLDHIILTFGLEPSDVLSEKKSLATEILSAWNTLLVLDNMETVGDGRILEFVQSFPAGTRAKVLMTSRQKTGGWELPFPLKELDVGEAEEFVKIRSEEMHINFPHDSQTIERVCDATGGLPLAIQWTLGRYKLKPDLKFVLSSVNEKDSPLLEFSFGNIWRSISDDARVVLAIMTIFDSPPTTQQICIATEFPYERVENALGELADVTLVTRSTQASDGSVRHVALPITLSFAQGQLGGMGDLELRCRKRYQSFSDQMKLHESEIQRVQSSISKFGLETDNEKRALFLCQKAESAFFRGSLDDAEILFKQAREMAPQSAYVWAMSASHELSRNRIGKAQDMITEACRRVTKRTGALVYTIKARIHFAQRDRDGRVDALSKAVEFDPEDNVLRHQYGVALSINYKPEAAVKQFTAIIEKELSSALPTRTLIMALKTRMINLKRLGKDAEVVNDLSLAKRLLDKYPHLRTDGEDFSEFEGNDGD